MLAAEDLANDLKNFDFSAYGGKEQVDMCAAADLPQRIREGFKGFVVVAAELIGQIDFSGMQKEHALEVMVLPPRNSVPDLD